MKKKVKKATKTINLRDLLMSSKNTITIEEAIKEAKKLYPIRRTSKKPLKK